MTRTTPEPREQAAIPHQRVELEGVRYVIVREAIFDRLCFRAGIPQPAAVEAQAVAAPLLAWDRATLPEKLVQRRRAAGLTQAELARRAGIRVETLNRIERGRSNPDFATIRRLVEAIAAVAAGDAGAVLEASGSKEQNDGRQDKLRRQRRGSQRAAPRSPADRGGTRRSRPPGDP